MIKCDEPMRRSKERAKVAYDIGADDWKCKGKCDSCICAMHKNEDGTWTHTKYEKKHERSARW